MTNFKVYYQKPETFITSMREGIDHITKKDIDKTHVYLLETKADDLNDLYRSMQGEIWSPNGEARELIARKGLKHTSMSVGDIAYDVTNNIYYVIDHMGVKELK